MIYTISSRDLSANLPVLMQGSPSGRVRLAVRRGLKDRLQVSNCPDIHLRRWQRTREMTSTPSKDF